MKQQTASCSRPSLQMIGVAFLALLVIFTACNNNSRGSSQTGDQTSATMKNTGGRMTGGACSSAEEFRAIIETDAVNELRGSQVQRIDFNSFDVEGPMHYQNSQDYYITNTDDAYRVTTDMDVLFRNEEMGAGRLFRYRYESRVFMCYTVTSRNTCICHGAENNLPKAWREDVTDQY